MASIINALSSGTGGIVTSGDASGILQLQTANTAAVTVTSSQFVGVGTTNPIGRLTVSNGGAEGLEISPSGGTVSLTAYNRSGAAYAQLNLTGTAGIGVSLGPSYITTNSNLSVTNIVGVGGATPASTGSGITFPATQSASSDANTLDDYEEGTWTPTLKFGGGTTGITYSQQFGQYTKIGRLVTCTFNIFLTSKGSSAGPAIIDNLPFTVFNGSGYYAGSMLQPYKINYVDGGMISMYVDKQNNALYLLSIPDTGAAHTDIQSGDFNNDSQVIGSFIYYV
jgi:hypothetical protein